MSYLFERALLAGLRFSLLVPFVVGLWTLGPLDLYPLHSFISFLLGCTGWRRFVRGISSNRIIWGKIFTHRKSQHGLSIYRTLSIKEFSPQFEKDIWPRNFHRSFEKDIWPQFLMLYFTPSVWLCGLTFGGCVFYEKCSPYHPHKKLLWSWGHLRSWSLSVRAYGG